jgi:type VI secretion system protein ImpI
MLKLRIENFDRLPDGGPLEYSVDRRGFDFGRDGHLDWTLPDKGRVVSGKHCEIRYREDAYWLVDVSTNGTYVNGSTKRVNSPYQLNEGDRLQVGEYILAVSLNLPPLKHEPEFPLEPQDPQVFAPTPGQAPGRSIWDTGAAARPPLEPRDLMPAPAPAEVAADYLNQALYVPAVEHRQEEQPRPSSKWSPSTEEQVQAPPSPPQSRPSSSPTEAGQFGRRFAKGAGLEETAFSKVDDLELAELSGQLLMLTTHHLMMLLQARAEAKSISRSGKRTMIKAAENNPLKFLPTAEEALQVMLTPRGKGYLGPKETLESTFADLKLHHFTLLAAMQAAANDLLNEMSPDAVEKSSGNKKSLLGGNKGKLWDEIVIRWAAKSGKRENGMLDAFLDAFAEHYDAYSKRKI